MAKLAIAIRNDSFFFIDIVSFNPRL